MDVWMSEVILACPGFYEELLHDRLQQHFALDGWKFRTNSRNLKYFSRNFVPFETFATRSKRAAMQSQYFVQFSHRLLI